MSTSLPSRDYLPELTTSTIVGITIAVTGNVLISLALNLQKLAHHRLDAQQKRDSPSITPRNPHEEQGTEPLLFQQSQSDYGTLPGTQERPFVPRIIPRGTPQRTTISQNGRKQPGPLAIDVDIVPSSTPDRGKVTQDDSNDLMDGSETEYLKSKLWWSGFLLMNVGELGNFISYAWAPASVVAPLGTFALIANCFFAPLLLKERFRKRDLFGILIAIIGAVTVVLASNASDTRLDPDALVKAICQIPFIIYSCIYIVGASILAILSEGPLGRRWVFVDVGLCALFGGFTVLSTKAVSTLLTMSWFDMFTQLITYPIILVLIATGVGQIRYLNRALMQFDSKIVIPVQFVLFNLSAIIGAAILYGDFRKATFHQVVTFLYGCAATFAGVFIIAWGPQNSSNNEPLRSDENTAASLSEARNSPETPSSTLGRRRRATLILGDTTGSPILRSKPSAMSLMGLSPAQHLLLVHTPPREMHLRDLERDVEGRSTRDSSIIGKLRHAVPSSADSRFRSEGQSPR